MKTKNKILFLVALAFFSSCAHKSGHLKRVKTSTVSSYSESETPSVRKTVASEDRMEGNQVFQKYHSAVFMVYTSDGSNVYQGSGFFIDGHGLAVSNYHVFKGTGIGAEAIKLENDPKNYNVSEIYMRNEEEDFILFRVDCGKTNYIPIANNKPAICNR